MRYPEVVVIVDCVLRISTVLVKTMKNDYIPQKLTHKLKIKSSWYQWKKTEEYRSFRFILMTRKKIPWNLFNCSIFLQCFRSVLQCFGLRFVEKKMLGILMISQKFLMNRVCVVTNFFPSLAIIKFKLWLEKEKSNHVLMVFWSGFEFISSARWKHLFVNGLVTSFQNGLIFPNRCAAHGASTKNLFLVSFLSMQLNTFFFFRTMKKV